MTIQRLGIDSDEGKLSVETIDYYIDEITAPLLDPILEIYRIEGAPFMSSFRNSSPWV